MLRQALLVSALVLGVLSVPVTQPAPQTAAPANPFTPTTTRATTTTTVAAAPTLTCPADITASAALGLTRAAVRFANPFVNDVPAAMISLTATHRSGMFFQLGLTRVTFYATDLMTGRAGQCSFNIRVIDNEAPVLACPASMTAPTNPGLAFSTVPYWTAPVPTDNDQVASLTSNFVVGHQFPLGNTVVVYTATDPAGNTATCTFTVTIVDVEPPRITCPGPVSQYTDTGLATGRAEWAAPNVTDNSGRYVAVVGTATSGSSVFLLGESEVTYTATDLAGNTASCTFAVTIVDKEIPSITCPADVTVTTLPGRATGTATWSYPITGDNSGFMVTLEGSHEPTANSFPIGKTVVRYTATDAAGNKNSCVFVVTVNDVEAPIIECPTDVTTTTAPGLDIGRAVWASPTATDNSLATVTIMSAFNSGDYFPFPGPTMVVYNATDIYGNSATCFFAVTVTDREAPQITCPGTLLVGTDTGRRVYTGPDRFQATAEDNTDDSPAVRCDHDEEHEFLLGTTMVTCTATDAEGNSNKCTFPVVVTDFEKPQITCPDDLEVSTDPDSAMSTVSWTVPSVSDNSEGIVTLWSSRESGDRFLLGRTPILYTATDAYGNFEECVFRVDVRDRQPPAITCPADITVTTDPGLASGTAYWNLPAVTDNSGMIVTRSGTHNSGDSFHIGATSVTYTARDDAGNENKCTFVVTVIDDEIPQMICPADVTVTVDHNSDGGTAYFTMPVLYDNSDSVVTVSCDHNSGDSSYKIGQTMVVCTAHDTAGNKDICSFVVTVVDNEPPVLTCPPAVVVYTELNLNSAIASWDLPVRTDNSKGVVQLDVSIAPGSRFPLGVTAVKYVGEDPSRNKNTCEFSVTVIDKQIPNIFCPADLTVSTDPRAATAAVVWALPVTWDNSLGPVVIEGTHQPGNRFAIGKTAVRYTAVDSTGNTNFCVFQITVVDVEAPTISCPADVLIDTNLGTASGTARWLVPQVAQNVADNSNLKVTVTGTANSGALFPIGTTFVTYTAVDLAGNAASCVFRVVVQDREAPRMLCPADVNTVTDAGLPTGRVSWRVPKASDNNQQFVAMRTSATAALTNFPVGTTTVSYWATDVFGNNATCSFLVRVRDTEAPRITCPASQVVTTLANRTTGAATWIVPNATDNMPGQLSVQSNRLPGDASFPMGLSVVRYTATDASGNINTCAFTITVLDVQAPRLLLCPASISIGNDKGMPTGRAFWTEPKVFDNSNAQVALTSNFKSGAAFPVQTLSTVTYTAMDQSGNTLSCSFTVYVTDVEAPTLVCPRNVLVPNDPGQNYATVFWTEPQPFDNSGTRVNMTFTAVPGQQFPLGVSTVTYRASDPFGNSAWCSMNITVVDAERPVVVCPVDMEVTTDAGKPFATVSWPSAFSADNSKAAVTVTASAVPGSQFALGTTVVSVRAMDAVGWTAMCKFNIRVVDRESPVISCPANVTAFKRLGLGWSTGPATWAVPVATDNAGQAGLVVTGTGLPGEDFSVGTTAVVYTARDAAGNRASCTFFITIQIRTIAVKVRVVDSETALGMANMDVSVVDFTPRILPASIATTARATTARATTTTRRTKAAARRAIEEEESDVQETVVSRVARQVVTSNVVVRTNAAGVATLRLNADPRPVTFFAQISASAQGQFDLDVYEGMPSSVTVVIAISSIAGRDEWRFVTSWLESSLPATNNLDAQMVTPYSCRVSADTLGCVDVEGFRMAELNANFAVNDTLHQGSGPETISVSGTQSGVYRHFVYLPQPEGSFVQSQAQVCVHRNTGMVSCMHVGLDGATTAAGSSAGLWRFWHTYVLNLNSQSVVAVNAIRCDPSLSTGSTAELPNEQPRRC
eukprot:m.89588 g.89588  ORF g.89588 m.89588 type:complete len:1841 (-) comp13665_c1_seq2:33-5555(-)